MSLMQWLLEKDGAIQEMIHSAWRQPWLDAIMPSLSSRHRGLFLVIPLVLAILAFRRWKGVEIILICLIAAGMTDLLSSRVLKPAYARPRPIISGSYSFPSSHAANTAAVAVVLAFYLPVTLPLTLPLIIGVGYSRIYLGAHYPLDVAGGWAVGMTVAVLILALRQKLFTPDRRNLISSCRSRCQSLQPKGTLPDEPHSID